MREIEAFESPPLPFSTQPHAKLYENILRKIKVQ